MDLKSAENELNLARQKFERKFGPLKANTNTTLEEAENELNLARQKFEERCAKQNNSGCTMM